MYVFLLSLLLLDGILLYWIFVCFCSATPDKLTSPPPFTGLGASTPCVRPSHRFHPLSLRLAFGLGLAVGVGFRPSTSRCIQAPLIHNVCISLVCSHLHCLHI